MNSAKVVLVGLLFSSVSCYPKELESMNSIEGDETERIVNGMVAVDGQFPWAVALYFQGTFHCTGSLISTTTVLTAGHCVFIDGSLRPPGDFSGTAGSVNRSSSQATVLKFSDVMIHPGYEESTLKNDIAFLKLATPIEVNDRMRPVCIANANTPLDNYIHACVMGWGSIDRYSEGSVDILRYSIQGLAPHIACQVRYPNIDPRKQMCSDGLGAGICNGDSGGPLVHQHQNSKAEVQLGVASFIRPLPGCGSFIIAPGVFTRVSAYTDWLQQATGDSNICTI